MKLLCNAIGNHMPYVFPPWDRRLAVSDVFIYGPNAVGAMLGVVQLLLILVFPAIQT